MFTALNRVYSVYKGNMSKLAVQRNRKFPALTTLLINSRRLRTDIHINILLEILDRYNLVIELYLDALISECSNIIDAFPQQCHHIIVDSRNVKSLVIRCKRNLCIRLQLTFSNTRLANYRQVLAKLLNILQPTNMVGSLQNKRL